MSANRWARRRARRALVQAVYQWQMAGSTSQEIEDEFHANGSLDKADGDFFQELLRGVLLNCASLDEHLAAVLDRPLNELSKVELAVLRLGVRELESRQDVPYRVVITEYVELAKLFGAEEGHKYVNGVLDKVARSLRAVEVAGRERV
ncbi:MAG: transcription antitermination factor NusB [Pseudomonadales bacterium]